MDGIRTHNTHRERQEQRNNCRKLQTIFFPSTDVETVDKYILRSNVWTLSCQKLSPNEHKGSRKNSRETKDQLLIDKVILKNYRRRPTNY